MNIKVPYKWLNEIVTNTLKPQEIANFITLRSSSCEKIEVIENDSVLDIEITPNRGDNLSILGIAREFYAICKAENINAKFNNPFNKVLNTSVLKSSTTDTKKLTINIKDTSINPRFTAVVIDNVKITQSPKYIQTRLIQCGMRPINNIVDLTNYIMLLTGQPMHAFDYNKIGGGVMEVTKSTKGESITTLDGIKRELPINSVIIKDNTKIIDLCGIMGGENSAISNNTKTIVLFTQIYNGLLLRKTSLALNHRTEAVLRFEKGLDPLMQDKALFLSLSILKESTNYDVVSPLYDLNNTNYKNNIKATLTFNKLNKYANTTINPKIVVSILQALGFKINKLTSDKLSVLIPSYRIHDIAIEEDLIEEVVRIYGYEKIGFKLPKNYFDNDILNNTNKVERVIKNYLKACGYNELLTISMVPKAKVNIKNAVKIDNPLGADMEYLRTTQETILKDAILNNNKSVNVFELSKVYKNNGTDLPNEYKKLALLSNTKNSNVKILNTVKNLLKILNIQNYSIKQKNSLLLVYINKKLTGKISFKKNYTFAELLYKNLVKNYNSYPNIQNTYNTNIVVEDLTIHTNLNSIFIEIANKIKKLDANILSVSYSDSFIKNDKRALTITLKYQNKNKDIEASEVTEIRNKVIEFVEKKLGFVVDKPENYKI